MARRWVLGQEWGVNLEDSEEFKLRVWLVVTCARGSQTLVRAVGEALVCQGVGWIGPARDMYDSVESPSLMVTDVALLWQLLQTCSVHVQLERLVDETRQ